MTVFRMSQKLQISAIMNVTSYQNNCLLTDKLTTNNRSDGIVARAAHYFQRIHIPRVKVGNPRAAFAAICPTFHEPDLPLLTGMLKFWS